MLTENIQKESEIGNHNFKTLLVSTVSLRQSLQPRQIKSNIFDVNIPLFKWILIPSFDYWPPETKYLYPTTTCAAVEDIVATTTWDVLVTTKYTTSKYVTFTNSFTLEALFTLR